MKMIRESCEFYEDFIMRFQSELFGFSLQSESDMHVFGWTESSVCSVIFSLLLKKKKTKNPQVHLLQDFSTFESIQLISLAFEVRFKNLESSTNSVLFLIINTI